MRPLLVGCLLFALSAPLVASGERIQNLYATANGSLVSVRFELAHAFDDPDRVEGLQSGLPTSFTYVIEIFRDRPYWLDEGVARSRIEVVTTFNSVTREYLLNYRRDRRLVRSETFSDLATLQKRMSTVDEEKLFDIDGRRPYKMKVRVKADIGRGWMLYLIPWQISTRWRVVRVHTLEERP